MKMPLVVVAATLAVTLLPLNSRRKWTRTNWTADNEPFDFRTDAEADADVLASAGLGTDDDYGCYDGGAEEFSGETRRWLRFWMFSC